MQIKIADISTQRIFLGWTGENKHVQFAYDFTDVFAEYPDAGVGLTIKPPTGYAYPHTITRDGTTVLWEILASDCAVVGDGVYQFTFTQGETVAKSLKGFYTVKESLTGSGEAPTPVQNWIADAEAALFALTGMTARAETLAPGSSATASIVTENGRKVIVIGVPEGQKGAKGDKGDTGLTPAFTIGTVSTLPPDADATVTITGTPESPVFNFGIPHGVKGSKGDKGDPFTYEDFTPEQKAELVQGPILSAQQTAVEAVNTAGATKVQAVNAAGNTQVQNVNTAGATQVQAVNTAGTNQVAAVNAKGQEVLDSIPADYSEMTEDVNSLKSAITNLETGIDTKAGRLVDTVSGAVASFVPDATIENLLNVSVDVEPVQDLHGQDAPYPPGGGKNILPFIGRNETKSGVTVSYNESDSTYILNGTSNALFNVDLSVIPKAQLPIYNAPTVRYVMSVAQVSGSMTLGEGTGITFAIAVFNDAMDHYFRGNTNATNFTSYVGYAENALDTDSSYHLMIQLWRVGTVFNNLKLRVQIVNSTVSDEGWTPWTPYSNECPITGWTSADIGRIGSNLFDTQLFYNNAVAMGYPSDRISYSNGVLTWTTTSYAERYTYYEAPCGYKGNARYTITFNVKTISNDSGSASFMVRFIYSDSQRTTISVQLGAVGNEQTITLTSDAGKIVSRVTFGNWGYLGTAEFTNIQLAEGSTASEYEAYQGTTIPITFPSSAGTVYGAKLNATAGKLIVDSGIADLGSISWTEDSNRPGVWYGSIIGRKVSSNIKACSVYAVKNISVSTSYNCYISGFRSYGNSLVFIRDTRTIGKTGTEVSALLSGEKCVYELATPIEIDLDPVTISRIAGQTNHLWADTGDVTVTFAADVKAYIDSKITEAVANALNA